MKGRWESNINAWFPFMYSQRWNCAALLFPKQNYNVLYPNSYAHISVGDLYISRIGLSILLQPNMWTDPGTMLIANKHMNVGIGTEAVQLLFREYINWIFGTVHPYVAAQLTLKVKGFSSFRTHSGLYAHSGLCTHSELCALLLGQHDSWEYILLSEWNVRRDEICISKWTVAWDGLTDSSRFCNVIVLLYGISGDFFFFFTTSFLQDRWQAYVAF